MDATQRVFLGQDNTGDALVYGGMGDTNLKLLNAALINKNKQAVTGTDESGKTKKAATGKEIKPDYYYQWTAEFQPRLNQLDEIGSQFYAKGVDPYDPSNGQVYVEFQKEQNKLANDMQVSNELGKYHSGVMAQINQGDKKYSKESVEAFNSYFNRSFKEVQKDLLAGKTPPAIAELNTFDFLDYTKNITASIGKEENFTDLGVKDGIQSELVVKQRSKAKVDPVVEMDYINDPKKQEYFNEYYKTLNPGTKAYWEAQGKKLGKMPQILAAQDYVHRTVEGKEVSKNGRNINDNYYWGSKDGQGKIDKRKKIINTVLTGTYNAPNDKVKNEAVREWTNMYAGKEVAGVTINKIEIRDGKVIGKGTAKVSNGWGDSGKMVDAETILLDFSDRGSRSARKINDLLNESGLEEIPSDYFDQVDELQEITITPTNKKTGAANTPSKKTGLSSLDED